MASLPALRSSLGRSLVFFLILGAGFATISTVPVEAQDLPAPVYEVNGRVLDPEGQPKEGATVVLAKGGANSKNATTGSDGKYKFTGLDAGEYELTASHSCCSRAHGKVSVGGTTIQTTAADLQLTRKTDVAGGDPILLRGVAKDKDSGERLAGVNLEIDSYYGAGGDEPAPTCPAEGPCAVPVRQSSQHFSVVTGADGSYELEVNRGSLSAWASLEGYDSARASREVPEDTTLDVPMKKGEGQTVRLHGVVKGSDGRTLPGAYLNVGPDYNYGRCSGDVCTAVAFAPESYDGWTYESSANQWNSTTTKDDGSWEMFTTPGSKSLQAYAENYLDARITFTVANDEARRIDLVLERIPPDSVKIHGQVVDAESGEGVAYANVNVENQKWGAYNWTRTDEQGRFTLYAKPGYALVTASAYLYDYAPCPAPEPMPYAEGDSVAPMPACESKPRDRDYLPRVFVVMAAENEAKELNFKLIARPSPTSEFTGYVLNGTSNQGVAGAQVSFYNELTRDWGSATTDEDGSYRIQVHAGYYTVRVWAEHHFDLALNTEIGEKKSERLDLRVEPGEKRYGWCCYGYMGHADYAQGAPAPRSAQESGAAAPPTPTEGFEAYKGEGGGLGPYTPQSLGGGKAPGPALGLVAASLLGALAFVRWGRRGR